MTMTKWELAVLQAAEVLIANYTIRTVPVAPSGRNSPITEIEKTYIPHTAIEYFTSTLQACEQNVHGVAGKVIKIILCKKYIWMDQENNTPPKYTTLVSMVVILIQSLEYPMPERFLPIFLKEEIT